MGKELAPATLNKAATLDYWKALNPELSITRNPFQRKTEVYQLAEQQMAQQIRQITQEGYLQTPPLIPRTNTERLAQCVLKVVDAGFPPIFVFVYDEFWQICGNLSQVLTPVLGPEYKLLPDFWVWCIEKNASATGFKPHRDHQHGRQTLRADGRPTILTAWIPFTDVTTLNSCMYVLPTNLDPNLPDNFQDQTVREPVLQCIRALPAEAGSILAWNSYILHWGARSSEWATLPRISLGIYFQSGDVAPYDNFMLDIGDPVPFELRLGTIARAILMYNNNKISDDLRFPQPLLRFCQYHFGMLQSGRKPPIGAPRVDVEVRQEKPSGIKIGRNEPCTCGSGKKYKHCHGRVA